MLLYIEMVLIVKPYQRFGNNILQMIHAIHIAETFGIRVIRFNFDHFTTNVLYVNSNTKSSLYKDVRIVDKFYYETNNLRLFPGLLPMTETDRNRIACTYLKPILKHVQPSSFLPDYENTLFVHIRSGDVFSEKIHAAYIQPPVDYYRLIFSLEKSKQIVVIYEDEKNPVVNVLREQYPHILFYTLPLLETISVFLHAKYAAIGFGTFIPSILSMNMNCEKVYSMKKYCPIPWKNSKCVYVRLPRYLTSWVNTEENRTAMVTYKGARV